MEINNVVIDTGSSHTAINPDFLSEIGVSYENGDIVYEAYGIGGNVHFYSKKMDSIEIGDFKISSVEIDVSILPNEHSGLLGLDILLKSGFILDLNNLELSLSKS
ncbi:retropepsin-like aspartic protease [Pullulanibacillus sp. KACC 23026]|uniref:retropepsin-like aspartic protease n=1 Tax=Pullulanibacillus sp. KACC 23026 TaxID=3028315 RepID=UPI0023B0177D|nr:retropepsin-like aspartic protease [Pullulanibacillus sp. KACC 23026]WEG10778.1 retropepsin-like aspartic protease [Pullulanibacillus sp. KACC 23026]